MSRSPKPALEALPAGLLPSSGDVQAEAPAAPEQTSTARSRPEFSQLEKRLYASGTSESPARWRIPATGKRPHRKIAGPGLRHTRRLCRSNYVRHAIQSAPMRCSEKDRAENTKPAQGKGGAQRYTTGTPAARSAAGCSSD